MPTLRHAKWSAALLVLATVGLNGQEGVSLQTLYESGNDAAVIERAGEGRASSAEDTYMAALAYLRTERQDAAIGEFRRLSERDDEAWRLIGQSGVARLEHNSDEAVNAARRATEVAGDNLFAHYQLGLAASDASDWSSSSRAFTRAAELKPDFAYAHYSAGLTQQKNGDFGKASEHYAIFLRLAPEAPERPAVLAILRAMRK